MYSFDYALRLMQAGTPMRRQRWSRKNKFVVAVYPKEELAKPYLQIHVDQESYGPYTPAQCDLFEQDWVIADDDLS
jgi:hypothetical protein